MGLSKAGDTHRDAAAALLPWLLPACVALMSLLLMLGGDTVRERLRFDRTGIAAGEVWRLVSGHFVHLGVSHTLLNIAGLALVWILVGAEYSRGQWLGIMAASIAAIDLGLWFMTPELQWYVGLSGLLHGLLAAGIIAGMAAHRAEAWLIAVLVGGKLVFEQWVGPLPGSEATSGGAVVVDAHLYGVIGGALTAVLLHRVRGRAPI